MRKKKQHDAPLPTICVAPDGIGLGGWAMHNYDRRVYLSNDYQPAVMRALFQAWVLAHREPCGVALNIGEADGQGGVFVLRRVEQAP